MWSVVEMDDKGSEGALLTVSNAHIATCTAYLETISPPKKKPKNAKSEEDIFFECLEKQIFG